MGLSKIYGTPKHRALKGVPFELFTDFKSDCGCGGHGHKIPVVGEPFQIGPDNRRKIQVIGAIADNTAQQRGAFRLLVQNNVHGIANKLYSMLQKDPISVTAPWIAQGGEPNTLMHDIVQGNSKPYLDAANAALINLQGNTGKAKIGATGGWPPTIQSIQFYAADTGQPFATGTDTNSANNYLEGLYSAITAGQNQDGYYGMWYQNNTNFSATSGDDANLRNAYNSAIGWWGGANNILVGSPTGPVFPAPKPVGTDKNTGAVAGGSGCTGASSAASAANIANSIIPGLGNIIANIANVIGGATGSPCSVVDTSPKYPPPPPPIIQQSNTGIILVGLAVLATAAFFAFKD